MQVVLARGDNLILFPEGTSSDGSRVLPFRSSFFAVAEGKDIADPNSPAADPTGVGSLRPAQWPARRPDEPAGLCLVWRHGPRVAFLADNAAPRHAGDGAAACTARPGNVPESQEPCTGGVANGGGRCLDVAAEPAGGAAIGLTQLRGFPACARNRGKSVGNDCFFPCVDSTLSDSLRHAPPPVVLSALSRAELEALLLELFGEVAALKKVVEEQREEIARQRGLKGRPTIRPSGMEQGTEPPKPSRQEKRRGRGKVTPRVSIEETVIEAAVPPGSRFKGYEPYLIQDLVISVHATCYQRERWVTSDGRTILAPLPDGIAGHFGPELHRFALMQYHQGQTTSPRLLAFLRSAGVAISKRQLQRLLTDRQDGFVGEALAVLRAGLETSPFASVDDTGARHDGENGICTQIGNDWFTWFGTRSSKSRLNFLDLLRAGHPDHVLNETALAYLRDRGLSGPLIAGLAEAGQTYFADQAAWQAHLRRVGIVAPAKPGLAVIQAVEQIATEGLCGVAFMHTVSCVMPSC